WFRLMSNLPQTKAQIDAVYGLVWDAYSFDTNRQQLQGDPALDPPIEVVLARNALMKQITNQAGGGICWDADSFITNHTITSPKPYDQAFEANTVAHELEHMHHERMKASETVVPIYAYEGIACVAGDAYLHARNVAGRALVLAEEANTLAALTGVNGHDLFDHFATKYGDPARIYERELNGALFLEFVATHMTTTAIFPAWGGLLRAIRAGTAFPVAFKAAFGVALDDAKVAYIQFLDATATDRAARFRGTVWAGN